MPLVRSLRTQFESEFIVIYPENCKKTLNKFLFKKTVSILDVGKDIHIQGSPKAISQWLIDRVHLKDRTG